MYRVSLHKKAVKYYDNLDARTAKKINKAIEEIGENPFEGPHIKKMRGTYEGKYRYAAGDLRIIYMVDTESRIILIEAIGPRGDVYK